MNRKKALILIMALQFMLLAMLIVLFISHVMSVSAFASAIIIVGVVIAQQRERFLKWLSSF